LIVENIIYSEKTIFSNSNMARIMMEKKKIPHIV